MRETKCNRAFTLVELIIVIAVIGILAAILIPTFANVISKANAKSALSDAKNTLTIYLSECVEDDSLPEQIVIFVEKANKWYVYGYDGLSKDKQLRESAANPIDGYKGDLPGLIAANNAPSATDFGSGKLFFIYPSGSGYEEVTDLLSGVKAETVRAFHGVLFETNAVAATPSPAPQPTSQPTSGFSVTFEGVTTVYTTLDDAWAYATGDTITTGVTNRAVVRMYENAKTNACLVFENDNGNITKGVTLDLNGYTIDRGLSASTAQEYGSVITISGMADLVITDMSEDASGLITGGNTTEGAGGICVVGKLTLASGTISGNKANASGGGIGCSGGGRFYMTGGAITGNTAGSSGGGIAGDSGIYLSGGLIADNVAGNCGGGVFCSSTISGPTISGDVTITRNTAGGIANNLQCTAPFIVSSELMSAHIGVTSFTAPTADAPVKIGTGGGNVSAKALLSDDDRYEITIDGDDILLAIRQS